MRHRLLPVKVRRAVQGTSTIFDAPKGRIRRVCWLRVEHRAAPSRTPSTLSTAMALPGHERRTLRNDVDERLEEIGDIEFHDSALRG